jgi:tetratricopeptide (TPR) repeat protein
VDSRPLSRGRRWFYRLLAALLVPVLTLVAVEVGLRLAGYGHPASFFVKTRIHGENFYVNNDFFGIRFFPPELVRIPTPLRMAETKPPHTCRVFVLGESAALGDPEPAFGVGRYLQVLLQERYPGTRFEVVCGAMTAINSHALLPIARECAGHEGDLWVIYMGNNEFVGPFGAGTVFGAQTPPLWVVRLNVALKGTRLGQLISRLGSKLGRQKSWGGMKMFSEQQVAPDDPRKGLVYDHFATNLRDILAAGRSCGAKMVVSTVASNLKDCAPFASKHSASMTADETAQWNHFVGEGKESEKVGDLQGALTNYAAAAHLDEHHAETEFKLGRCAAALTNDAARRYFESARDNDSLAFRADSRINQIIRDTVSKAAGPDLRLSDAEARLAESSPRGITGSELMFEHVHPTAEGNYLLARTIAEQAATVLAPQFTGGQSNDWASAEVCDRKLALTDWDRFRVWKDVLGRISEPPFTGQLNHPEQMAAAQEKLMGLRARLTKESGAQARTVYEEALKAAPEDYFIQANFAKLCEDTGDLDGAVAGWQRVSELIPFAAGPYYYAGKLQARQGKLDQALQSLASALELKPDLPQAISEKGQVLVKQQRTEEGLTLLDRAAALQPANARLKVSQAEALARLNRRAESVARLREALVLQPGYAEAHYLLGVEMAVAGNVREAAEQFADVVKLTPDYPLGHLNLGIALAKLGSVDWAVVQFRETLRLEPENKKAAEYLANLERTSKPKQGSK